MTCKGLATDGTFAGSVEDDWITYRMYRDRDTLDAVIRRDIAALDSDHRKKRHASRNNGQDLPHPAAPQKCALRPIRGRFDLSTRRNESCNVLTVQCIWENPAKIGRWRRRIYDGRSS